MFIKISESVEIPAWYRKDARWKRLHILDRLLSGTFYNDLAYAFYDETGPRDEYIPLTSRRPSVQHNVPSFVAHQLARKLFAGENQPRLVHSAKNEKGERVQLAVAAICEEAHLSKKMIQSAVWGSVGASAITFKVIGEGEMAKVCAVVLRAKQCYPTFDEYERLDNLRSQYVVNGSSLRPLGFTNDAKGDPIRPGDKYWFTKDITKVGETIYMPISVMDYIPCEDGDEKLKPSPDPKHNMVHDLGFVQAQWFENLSGGESPDGACTWEPAINMNIEMDYTMSQCGRAIRYNASPQVVTQGELLDENGEWVRSPDRTISFRSTERDAEGNQTHGGDAHLLEMKGDGIKVGIDYVDRLRKRALEMIAASRKDSDEVKVMSGKAMEMADSDYLAFVAELRTAWCDCGYLPMVKHIALAAIAAGHPVMQGINPEEIDGLMLEYPKGNLTPDEMLPLVQSMVQGVEGGVIEQVDAKAYLYTHFDFPSESANRDLEKSEQPYEADELTHVVEDKGHEKKAFDLVKDGQAAPVTVDESRR